MQLLEPQCCTWLVLTNSLEAGLAVVGSKPVHRLQVSRMAQPANESRPEDSDKSPDTRRAHPSHIASSLSSVRSRQSVAAMRIATGPRLEEIVPLLGARPCT